MVSAGCLGLRFVESRKAASTSPGRREPKTRFRSCALEALRMSSSSGRGRGAGAEGDRGRGPLAGWAWGQEPLRARVVRIDEREYPAQPRDEALVELELLRHDIAGPEDAGQIP